MSVPAPLDGQNPVSRGETANRNETMEELPTPLTGAAPSGEPRQVATENDRNEGVSAPLPAPLPDWPATTDFGNGIDLSLPDEPAPLPVGHHLDAAVCTALGIPGWPIYYAAAPGHTDTSWYIDDLRHLVQEAIDAIKSPSDWRYGSTLKEVTHYPPVSKSFDSARAVLAKVSTWPFSKRRAFTTALSSHCRIAAIPPETGCDTVAWPDALIHFRESIAEFVCRAALEVAQGGGR